MITEVRQETIDSMVFNAGVLLKDFDYSMATDAATLKTAVVAAIAAGTGVLGATKGGVNPQCNFTFWQPEADGMRMSFKGSKQLDNCDCIISGTLVEFNGDNIRDVLALADKSTTGNITTVQPRFEIKAGDYIDHLIWVGDWGGDGLILVDLKNALSTTGLNSQTTDKDIGTLPFEFHGHADSVSSSEIPMKYLLFTKA